MTIEQAKFLQHITDSLGNQECEIREGYSGRGMYGAETVGVVVDSVTTLLMDTLNYFTDHAVDHEGVPFQSFRIDSMGRSTILY